MRQEQKDTVARWITSCSPHSQNRGPRHPYKSENRAKNATKASERKRVTRTPNPVMMMILISIDWCATGARLASARPSGLSNLQSIVVPLQRVLYFRKPNSGSTSHWNRIPQIGVFVSVKVLGESNKPFSQWWPFHVHHFGMSPSLH